MRKFLLHSTFIVSVVSLLVVSCNSNNQKTSANEPPKADSVTLVKRGEYLVMISGCDDCHSPKTMGPRGPELIPELRLSGYPSSRPIQEVDKENLKKGWALMGADLTSAVGPCKFSRFLSFQSCRRIGSNP